MSDTLSILGGLMGGLNSGLKAYSAGQRKAQNDGGDQDGWLKKILGVGQSGQATQGDDYLRSGAYAQQQGYGGIPDYLRNSDPLYYGMGTIQDSKGNTTTLDMLQRAAKDNPDEIPATMWDEYVRKRPIYRTPGQLGQAGQTQGSPLQSLDLQSPFSQSSAGNPMTGLMSTYNGSGG